MNAKAYRWCAVPQCENTSIKTPNKLFVFVPQKKSIRDQWLKSARRDASGLLPTSHLYFCEDHFDLPNDMENYMKYHVMGFVSQIRMNAGCIPTKFECQLQKRKRRRKLLKQRKVLIEECENMLGKRTVKTIKDLKQKEVSVPLCTNTSIKTPEKMFVSIPKHPNIRKRWLMLARRDPNDIVSHSNTFMCEDHFNLKQDMINYMQYKMGFSQTILMVKGTMPSKFDCQVNYRKILSDTTMSRKAYKKRLKINQGTQSAADLPRTSIQKDDSVMLESASEVIVPRKVVVNIPGASSSNMDNTRLYLQMVPGGDVSVPCKSLAQHQIDGIRFLFKQYMKTKGVILNYPAGCGKSVLVALFINTVIGDLNRPVLILYESNCEKQQWLELFTNWTTIPYYDIAVDPANICVKKPIVLTNITEMPTCSSRTWSMVVVKREDVNKILFKWQLNVDFKIWITSVDMMLDMEMLLSVYKWTNGSSDRSLEEFLKKKLDPNVLLTYDILLLTFLEDFLLRRTDLEPFVVVPGTSRKNKDATGKKIKRSQKRPESSLVQQLNTHSEVLSSGNIDDGRTAKKTRKSLANEHEESKMDVESFIRDNEPIQTDKFSVAINNLDDGILYTKGRRIQKEINTDSCLEFGSAVEEIVRVENKSREKVDSQRSKAMENSPRFEEIVFNPMDVYAPKIQHVFSISTGANNSERELGKGLNVKSYGDESTRSGDEEIQVGDESICIKREHVQDGDESTRSGDEEIQVGDESIRIKTEQVQDGDDSTCSGDEEIDVGDVSIRSKTEELQHCDDNTRCRDEGIQGGDESLNGRDESIHIKDEDLQAGDVNSIGDNGIPGEDTSGTNIEDNRVCEGESICIKNETICNEDEQINTTLDQANKLEVTTSDSVFDSKMREIEERALKKFKGSFLDNIF